MSSRTTTILEKIKTAEAAIEKLIPLRKEEIYNVLHAAGGITLDNQLLAGIALFAANPSNKDSTFLRELRELGKTISPSNKSRSKSKA
jgi:hypothetical protein